MLKSVYHKADETTAQKTYASVQQSLAAMNTHLGPTLNTRTDHPDNREGAETCPRPKDVNLEEVSIHFLRTYSVHPDWKQIISSCNDYGQTMAHISMTLGYLRLLRHLFTWEIDLNVVDNMGLTALHYAYLFKQEDCAKFLIQSGVNQFILDDLGRSPSDLDPSLEVRLHSVMDIDNDGHTDSASPIEYDTEMPVKVGKLHAKHFLVQQWMRRDEDEGRDEVPPSRYQSSENLETSADWTNPSNGGGWTTPESNPDTNVWGKQLEEHTKGNGLTARFDWAEDTERTFPISQLSGDINTAWPTPKWGRESPRIPEASKQEPASEVVKDMVDDWMADNPISDGSRSVEDTASGWDDPSKVAEPAGGITPSDAMRDTNDANENAWNTVPSQQQKLKPVAKKFQSLTPTPSDKDNWPRKGPMEKDWKVWGRGGKEEGPIGSTGARNSVKKGKKGDKPPPTPAANLFANTSTKIRPAKEKRQDQATGPKDAFTFNRVTSSLSSVVTTQDTRNHQDEEPDLDSLPELPPDLQVKNYPPEFEMALRQAVVPKFKIPSIAPLPENTDIDKGMNWVNGKLKTVRNTDTPKGFSERKVQVDDTNG